MARVYADPPTDWIIDTRTRESWACPHLVPPPGHTTLYIAYGRGIGERALYVGITADIRRRLSQHRKR